MRRPASTTTTSLGPSTTNPGSFDVFTVTGSGNDVIDFRIPGDVPAVVDLTHDGTGYFAVWSLDGAFEPIDMLVNGFEVYDGRRMVHGGWFFEQDDVRALEVDADGSWSVTARPMDDARSMTPTLSGSGNDIVRYRGSAQTLTSTHDGSSNFIITGTSQTASTTV